MGIIVEEIGGYDPYTDKFIKNTTTSRLEVGTDGSVYNLSLSSSYGLYAKNQEEFDFDKLTKLYTKDEVIAMLTNLQKKMEEYEPKWVENDEQAVASCRTWEDLDGIIQDKINTLREGEL